MPFQTLPYLPSRAGVTCEVRPAAGSIGDHNQARAGDSLGVLPPNCLFEGTAYDDTGLAHQGLARSASSAANIASISG